jgi:chitinase
VGTLPPGLLFEAGTCVLSGTPTAAGSYPFTVTATNGGSPDATIDSTVQVSPAPPTITGTPPSGQFWSLYSYTFTTTGNPTVTVSAGAPPLGLTLAPDGTLSGRPTRAGTYAFTVTADNGVSPVATEDVQIVIVPKPHITVTDARAKEGSTGLTALTFVVSLTRTGLYDIPVHWTTANGTAKAPGDYQAASGDLTFAPGELSKTITVQVRGDRVKERNETFSVRLSRTTHAEFDDDVAVGTIVNDD